MRSCLALLVLTVVTSSACSAMILTPASDTEGHYVIELAIVRKHNFELSPDAVRHARAEELSAKAFALNTIKTASGAPETITVPPAGGLARGSAVTLALWVLAPWLAVVLLRKLKRHVVELRERESRRIASAKEFHELMTARPPRTLRPRRP